MFDLYKLMPSSMLRFVVAVFFFVLLPGAFAGEGAPDAELVATTGNCPETLRVTGSPGDAIVLDFGGLSVRTDAQTPRARILCGIALRIDVPAGLQVLVEAPQILGSRTHDREGSANLSVRWYPTGEAGEEWFKRISGDSVSGDFSETPAEWQAHWHTCGESPELNVLIDLTARLRQGDEARFEALAVQQFRIPGVLFRRCEPAGT